MPKIMVNSRVFSRHLAKRLPNQTYMIFNMLNNSENGNHFKVIETDNKDLTDYCKNNGQDFIIDDQNKDFNINDKFEIVFN